jgi:CheY-like chemotaxis protein/anti-sigma regulatory factor (Ser/Thr protein kinase)
MTAILGFADILDQNLRSPDDQNCVEVIRQNGYHLLDLINNLLDLAHVETGKLDFSAEAFEVAALLRECVRARQGRDRRDRSALRLTLRVSNSDWMIGDRKRLKQILLNLIDNALKFAGEGVVTVRAGRTRSSDSRARHASLVLTVADTGPGMTERQLSRLFEPLTPGDGTNARRHEGVGVGLAMTKQIVDQMGGDLAFRSREGLGCVVRVKIPWIDPLPDAVAQLVERDRLEEPDLSIGGELSGRCVLVIDDRRDIRFIAEHMLRDAGAEVETAADGPEGIEKAKTRVAESIPYDCIITDIQMPLMDGYETTRNLRDMGYTGPVLALTANTMAEDRDECFAAGCDFFLSKPIDRLQLVQTIVELIAKRESRD